MLQTVNADIIFKINDKVHAIEVETGKIYHDQKRIREKVDILNKKYGKNWFFVATNRNIASQYLKFGDVYDKRYVAGKITKLVENREKS